LGHQSNQSTCHQEASFARGLSRTISQNHGLPIFGRHLRTRPARMTKPGRPLLPHRLPRSACFWLKLPADRGERYFVLWFRASVWVVGWQTCIRAWPLRASFDGAQDDSRTGTKRCILHFYPTLNTIWGLVICAQI